MPGFEWFSHAERKQVNDILQTGCFDALRF